MAIVDVDLVEESELRYLTYALSVVGSRALPDVRDGLKPVQRRILYAMQANLHLSPDKPHRKSAAVVGEVLARYHPHGDSACYEAMVRMAQDFSLRYPLVDGQGNFGSLDGDSAAAYRYTEARLTALALEVLGDIGQETVAERDNFDQTVKEPVVLPSRVPNLLINGASGIAVGIATAILPHNLKEVVSALRLLLEEADVSDSQLLSAIKGPDFPTGCLILNSKSELKEIYTTGRGAIRMRGDYKVEEGKRGRKNIVITSIPFALDKSMLVEKIADLIIARKVPQLEDVRDESTDEVRVVLELAQGADPEKAMIYLYKNTPLEGNFNVNLTALIPTENPLSGKPAQLSLRDMLEQFVLFRVGVTRAKLQYELGKLRERIHLLDGLMLIMDVLDEVIKIVRKSDGRQDAAQKLQKRFSLTEVQSFFIVDLRVYQLSRTSVEEVEAELNAKKKRVAEIEKILKSEKEVKKLISQDLQRISDEYGDARRSKVINSFEVQEFNEEEYVTHEDVHVIVTVDGWLKRIRQNNDPQGTRVREGDSLFFVAPASTRDSVALFTSEGNVFVVKVADFVATSGFGEPVQKICRFQDEEKIVACHVVQKDLLAKSKRNLIVYSERGFGFQIKESLLTDTKKTGRRVAKTSKGDKVQGVVLADKPLCVCVSADGYAISFPVIELPLLESAGKGVIAQKIPSDDRLVVLTTTFERAVVKVLAKDGAVKEFSVSELDKGSRARRGLKVVKRGLPVEGLAPQETKDQ